MLRKTIILLVIMSVSVISSTILLRSETAEEKIVNFQKQYDQAMIGKGKGGEFVGTKPCRACHSGKNKGAQFKIWTDSVHAKAYESLLSENGKKYAAVKGITKSEEDNNCLQCHAPLLMVPKDIISEKYKDTEGVVCEICHGPASNHLEIQKKAKMAKTSVPEDQEVLLRFHDPEAKNFLCLRCHKKHEWHETKDFNAEEGWEKIAHMIPTK